MNFTSAPASTRKDLQFIIRDAVFFLSYFLYVWLRINPALYNQRRDPIFLLDFRFFRGFLDYPGGLLDYLAALLSQLYYFPIIGALVVTAIAWGVTFLTAALIRTVRPGQVVQVGHFLPAIFLLIFHSHFTHPLAVSLGLLLCLLFVHFQIRSSTSTPWRIVSYLAAGLILYYIAAGPFLLFGLMCILYDAFYLRRPVPSIIYAALVVTIPYLAKETLFLINNQMAYVYLLPFKESYTPAFAPHLLVLYYILLFIIYHPVILRQFGFLKKFNLRSTWMQFGLQTILLFGIAALAAVYSFEKRNHLILQVDYYARHGRWQDIIKTSAQERSDMLQVAFHTNRALFHTGQLLENMFSFPQNNGVSGLVLPSKYSESAPLQESDFCYDLGSINEARHWAYEAVSTDGETPWILKRMVVVNFVSGDLRAAERCLNVLDKTLFFQKWAREFRKIMHNPALETNDPGLIRDRSMLVKTDFLISSGHPPKELDILLMENPKNKMAFEYRVAHELLTCLLGGLPKHLQMLNNFGYTQIPRHLEEALLIFGVMSKKREMPPIFRYIRQETFQRFKDFNQVLAKYNGDRAAAKNELGQKFADTYWYYMFYYNPVTRMATQVTSKWGGIE